MMCVPSLQPHDIGWLCMHFRGVSNELAASLHSKRIKAGISLLFILLGDGLNRNGVFVCFGIKMKFR